MNIGIKKAFSTKKGKKTDITTKQLIIVYLWSLRKEKKVLKSVELKYSIDPSNEPSRISSFFYWQLDYWKRRGIPGPAGTIFLGNMYDLTDLNKPLAFVLRDWTKKYGAFYGIQEGLRRTLVVSDVGMIRDLFMKQYDYFYGRKNFIIGGDVENDPRVHVFEAQGVRWKRLRTISTPAFSAASLKK
ncbi:hypothetical protein TELCIR_09515, partial [Teladorsagia circumcincta]